MSRIDKAIEHASRSKESVSLSRNIELDKPVKCGIHSIDNAGYASFEVLENNNPMLPTLADPGGFAAEQFRKLRALVIRKTQGEKTRNRLMVTSAAPGEGKTLTALNLAIEMARMPTYSVVLIDTDLRNPQLHKMLGVGSRAGLVQYLRGETSLEGILDKVGLGNLTLIQAGERVEAPLELLSSSRMKILIEELGSRYPDRYVLLDSPPVLPFADTRVLCEMVDSTIYVCREGHSSLTQIQQGLEALSEFDLLGIVCNEMSMSTRSDYGQYFGYQ